MTIAYVSYVLSILSGLYGLLWLVFAVAPPPSSIGRYFASPSVLFFLPERVGRAVMGLFFILVVPGLTQWLVHLIVG